MKTGKKVRVDADRDEVDGPAEKDLAPALTRGRHAGAFWYSHIMLYFNGNPARAAFCETGMFRSSAL